MVELVTSPDDELAIRESQSVTHPMRTDLDSVSAERKNLVKQLQKEVTYARDVFFRDDFEQMKSDMKFAFDGADPEWIDDGCYVANIVQRHISQKTATLYAKNPKAIAYRRPTMDFQIWDENPESIKIAILTLQAGIQDFNAIALLKDYEQGQRRQQMANRMAKSMEIVYSYFQNEQNNVFKKEMKQLVRRIITTGIGYIKPGFQRVNGVDPDVSRQLSDAKRRLDTLTRMQADQAAGEIPDEDPVIEAMNQIIKDLQGSQEIILREGLVWNFPMSTTIIPDSKTTNINSFLGADWVAEEYIFSVDEIKETWKVDVSGTAKTHTFRNESNAFFTGLVDSRGQKIKRREASTDGSKAITRCWRIYHKKHGLVYDIAEGYPDFLAEPAAPDVAVEGFWPYIPLTFNAIENEEKIFPHSDVFLMRDQQREINRQREGLRRHRIANKPKYITPRGVLEDDDKEALENHEDSAVIEINGMKIGQDSSQIVQPMKMAGIDPNLYDVSQTYDDLLRVLGSQEANFGGTSNATATESSIAESSRMSSISSNQDDLDMALSEQARMCGQILLLELQPETAKEIAGVGAVWPRLTREMVAKEIFLNIEAGSTGKPNQSLAIANLEKLSPFLIQLPDLDTTRLAKEFVSRLDDKLDVNEFIKVGAPSINAVNTLEGSPAGPEGGGGVSDEGQPNNQASRVPNRTESTGVQASDV